MANVRLRKLTVTAFRSFTDRTSFEFPDSGLVLVKGNNSDTKGSSGSGKSSLLLAISYAFGYCPFPATELQSWNTEDPLSVEVTFDTEQGVCVLTRSAGKSSLRVGSEPALTSASSISAKLRELTGLDTELLEALTYRPQNEPGIFLRKKNSEKLEFLVQVLGLERYEEEIKRSTKNITSLEEAERVQKTLLEQAEQALRVAQAGAVTPALQDEQPLVTAVEKAKQASVQLDADLKQIELDLAKAVADEQEQVHLVRQSYQQQTAEARKGIEEVQAEPEPGEDRSGVEQIEADLKKARTILARLRSEDVERQTQQQLAARTVEAQIAQLRLQVGAVPGAKRQQEELQRQIAQLEASVCPTCQRQWDDAQSQIFSMREKIAQLEATAQQGAEAEVVIRKLDKEVADLTVFVANPKVERMAETVNQLQRLVAVEESKLGAARDLRKAELAVRLSEAKTRLSAVVSETTLAVQSVIDRSPAKELSAKRMMVQQQAHEAKLDIRRAEIELERVQAANRMAQTQYEQRLAVLEEIQKKFSECEQRLLDATEKVRIEQDLQEFLKSWMQSYMEQILDSVSEESNRILAAVPNTQHCSLQFLTETMTEKGVVKKEIASRVLVGGHEARNLRSGLSGGMLAAVDLAVDIALQTVICERTGCYPGWLVLDEPFNGLGKVEKEACLEILATYANNRLVMMVDHASEFGEMFRQTIQIQYRNGVSSTASA